MLEHEIIAAIGSLSAKLLRLEQEQTRINLSRDLLARRQDAVERELIEARAGLGNLQYYMQSQQQEETPRDVNVAISERLCECPESGILVGLQL